MPMFPQREPGPRPNYTDYQTPDYGGQTAGIYARLPQWAQIAYQMDPDPMLRDVEPDYTPSQKWRSIFGAFAEFAGLMGGNPQLAGAGTKRIAEVEQERLAPLLQSYMSRASENAAELQRQEQELERAQHLVRLFPYIDMTRVGAPEALSRSFTEGDMSGLSSVLNPALPAELEAAAAAQAQTEKDRRFEMDQQRLELNRQQAEVQAMLGGGSLGLREREQDFREKQGPGGGRGRNDFEEIALRLEAEEALKGALANPKLPPELRQFIMENPEGALARAMSDLKAEKEGDARRETEIRRRVDAFRERLILDPYDETGERLSDEEIEGLVARYYATLKMRPGEGVE